MGIKRFLYNSIVLIALFQVACCRKSQPECRKAGVAVVVPPYRSLELRNISTNCDAINSRKLVVWAGKGNHREAIFDNSYSLNLNSLQWSGPLKQCKSTEDTKGFYGVGKSSKCQLPSDRWKTFSAYSDALEGILVWGGSTRPHAYFNDLWLMRSSKGSWFDKWLNWEQPKLLKCHPHDGGTGVLVPTARRAFGATLLPPNAKGKDGTLAVAYGRDHE